MVNLSSHLLSPAWNLSGRDWAEAISRFDGLSCGEISRKQAVVTCTEAIHSCGKSSKWRRAVSLLLVLQRKELADLVCYNSTLGACQKDGEWFRGLWLLNSIAAKLVPDIISFNSFISGCQGHWSVALDCLSGLLENQGNKLVPNVVTYSSVMKACEKSSWFVALSILDTMLEMMVLPNAVSYTTALSACAQEGRWDIAICLLESMATWQVNKNIISYNAAISACGIDGNWMLALTLLSAMDSDSLVPDVIGYNAALSACAGSWLVALHLYGIHMGARRVVRDPISSHSVLDVLRDKRETNKRAKNVGRWWFASCILKEMRRWELQQDSWSCSLSISSGAQSWLKALGVLSEMGQASIQLNSMNLSSALSCTEKCGWTMALAMLRSSQVDAVVCNGVLGILDCAEQWLPALLLVDSMRNSNKTPSTVTLTMAAAACKASKWLAAQAALSGIRELEIEQDVFSCSSCISMFEKCKNWAHAFDLVGSMSQDGIPLNLISYNSFLGALRSQKWTFVLNLFSEMGSRSLLPDEISYNGVISACEAVCGGKEVLSQFAELCAKKMRDMR